MNFHTINRIEDLFYTGILRQKAKMNVPKALEQSKWNIGREKETMCIHKGGINYEGIIRYTPKKAFFFNKIF